MSLFRRLITFGKSEAHNALDKLEDPIAMAEQGVRDLRADLNKSLESLASVKAQAIRAEKSLSREKEIAADYEQKAMALLRRAQSGELDAAEADRLATEALARKEQAVERAGVAQGEVQRFDGAVAQLESNVEKLKSQISQWDNELRTLKARAEVGQATRKLNQQLAKTDSSSTLAMLERMRDKVAQEEALAEAYGEIAQVERSVDAEIDAALGGESVKGAAALDALKKKMAMGANAS